MTEPLEMLPPGKRPAYPNTGDSPEWVIRTFLEGLREPHTPTPEDGFTTAYNLSTPSYRASVGHFDGFVQEMQSAFMTQLVEHDTVRRGPLEVDDDLTVADQPVLVTDDGEEYVYEFTLEQVADGKYEGCWLVDGVTLSMDDWEEFRHLPTVEYEGVEIKCDPGDRLRDVLVGVDGLSPHNGRTSTLNCGGSSLCGTCAVEIVDGSADPAADRTDRESRRLGLPPFRGSDVSALRLACQTEVTGDVRVRKHDGRFGAKPATPDEPWHEQFRDGETVRVSVEELEPSRNDN